jgi:catechol 2,3-dioxygenase-like lactoylglutathione lyase family enzyme
VLLGIDHVVLAVPDPDAAAALLEERLGLRPSSGGRHDALGTENRLVWLGDSYLELVGVFDEGLAARSWLGPSVIAALADGGGLATWAVAVDDLDGHLGWTAAGLLTGPIEGERRRPDDRIVRWRLARPDPIDAATPFLIEHDAGAAEWSPDERRERAAEEHPVGGRVRLASLELETEAPARVAGRLRSLLGATVEPEGRRGVRSRIGNQTVGLLAPREGDPKPPIVELITDAAIRRRTARIGSCELRLRGTPPPTAPPTEDQGAEGV